jgi:hypothetical protein
MHLSELRQAAAVQRVDGDMDKLMHASTSLAETMIGSNLKAQPERLGLTQVEAAHRAGVHAVEFLRAERGERDMRVSTVGQAGQWLGRQCERPDARRRQTTIFRLANG